MIWFRRTSIEPASPAGRTRTRLVALGGDQADFALVVALIGVDFLLLRDAFEDEMLFQGLGGRRHAVLPEGVLVRPDFLFAEPAALQFHGRPLQLAAGLPLQHRRRQVPIGGLRQCGGDLGPGPLVPVVFQLPAKLVADRVAQIAFVLETASSSSRSGESAGVSSFLTSSTLKIAVTLCPRSARLGAS